MVELALHQLQAVNKLHTGSVLKGGVGVGKTRTALAYYVLKVCGGMMTVNGQGLPKKMATPKDIYVMTTARKRDSLDWEEEAVPFMVSTNPEFSRDGVKIQVDSWNNIMKYTGIKDAFFIFDEQRLVGSGPWVKAFYKIAKQNDWIMLSATPGDHWMDYGPVFVANGFYKNITDFKRQHVVWSTWSKFPKVDRWVGQGRLERLRRNIVVDMPYTRHTNRIIHQCIVGYDKDLFDTVLKDRWNPYKDKPIESVAEYYYTMRKVVNSDESRVQKLRELMDDHPKLIVFYNFDYELHILRELVDETGVPSGEWNGHKHQEVPDGERWLYLVQYTAGAEAWNCTRTDALAFWSLNYSYKINEQAQGRIDRINTPFTDLKYYYLRSSSPIDREIMKSLASKKTFNERASKLAKPLLEGTDAAIAA